MLTVTWNPVKLDSGPKLITREREIKDVKCLRASVLTLEWSDAVIFIKIGFSYKNGSRHFYMHILNTEGSCFSMQQNRQILGH